MFQTTNQTTIWALLLGDRARVERGYPGTSKTNPRAQARPFPVKSVCEMVDIVVDTMVDTMLREISLMFFDVLEMVDQIDYNLNPNISTILHQIGGWNLPLGGKECSNFFRTKSDTQWIAMIAVWFTYKWDLALKHIQSI